MIKYRGFSDKLYREICSIQFMKQMNFNEGKSMMFALVYFYIGFIIDSIKAISSSESPYLV